MPSRSVVLLRRNKAIAQEVERILQLPDDMWTDVTVSFGMDEIGYAQVSFIISPEQLTQLATLAAYPPETEVEDNDQSDSDRGLDHPQRLEADDA